MEEPVRLVVDVGEVYVNRGSQDGERWELAGVSK